MARASNCPASDVTSRGPLYAMTLRRARAGNNFPGKFFISASRFAFPLQSVYNPQPLIRDVSLPLFFTESIHINHRSPDQGTN